MKSPYLFLALFALTAACKQNREIKVYRVAKETGSASQHADSSDAHAGVPGMMPGGVMAGAATGEDPHAGLSAEQLAAVGAAMPSAPRFSDSPPAHWEKQALSPMRLASYLIKGDGDAVVDISFSTLRSAPGGRLSNINRWRDQLGQAPIAETDTSQNSQNVRTAFGDAVVVDIEGLVPGADANKDGRLIGAIAEQDGNAWFFKMRGNPALTAAEKENFVRWIATVKPVETGEAPPVAAVPVGDGSLTWQVPDGWAIAQGAGSMRYATFNVSGADGSKAEMTVTHFPGDVGGDLENVNRWRQQVGADPVDATGLATLVSRITAGSKQMSLIDITGAQNRLVAGWVRHGPDTWFFKLTGPDSLIDAEKAKFTAFLESVRFNNPES